MGRPLPGELVIGRRAGALTTALSAFVIAAAALTGALAGGEPAHAAAIDEGPLQFSSDGKTWTQILSAPIYSPDTKLIPGSETTGTFYVRNNSAEPAWLRVGLSKLTVSSLDFAIAMNMTTVATTPGGAAGSTQNLGAGPVCFDFLELPQPISPYGIARIDASLWFRTTIEGTTAQQAGAAVSYIVQLSSADADRPTDLLCDPAGRFRIGDPTQPDDEVGRGGITGDPPAGPGSLTGPSSGGGPGGSSGNGGGAAGGGTNNGWSALLTGGEVLGTTLDAGSEFSNTVRRDEEYVILVLLGASIAGALVRLSAERRWGHRTSQGEA